MPVECGVWTEERRESGVAIDAGENLAASSFAAWAGRVAELCDLVAGLEPLADELGLPPARDAAWHGALFGKLRPQVT